MSEMARSVLARVVFSQNAMKSGRNSLQSVMQRVIRCNSNHLNDDFNRPLPFSKSKAASWSSSNSFSGKNKADDSPWYQPWIISLSVSAILIWFCVLREENDIDRNMDKSLYERVEGLEKVQLELCLKYNQQHGLDTKDIRKRLDELKKLSEKQ